jgi:hypothetical protein
MKSDQFTVATLASLGVVGFTAQASATDLITVPVEGAFGANITFGVDPGYSSQFVFSTLGENGTCNNKGCSWSNSYLGTTGNGLIASTGNNGVNEVLANLSYAPASNVQVGSNYSGAKGASTSDGYNIGSGYINLEFTNGAGLSEFGYATVAGGGVTSVTYAPAAPEPSTWALLIAGFGAMGVATRRRRRQSASLAA